MAGWILRLEARKEPDGRWLGECLELGIATEATSADEIKQRLVEAAVGHLEAAAECRKQGHPVRFRSVPFYLYRLLRFELRMRARRVRELRSETSLAFPYSAELGHA